MSYSHVFQQAYVVASAIPSFRELARHEPGVRRALNAASAEASAARADAATSAAAADRAGVVTAATAMAATAETPVPPGAASDLRAVGTFLASGLPLERGFVTEHFSPVGDRMYFTEENAGRIDAARRALHEWRAAGWIDESTYFILLAALIEGADRVANTAGVYAAYIKSWQPNARRPLPIIPELPTAGPAGGTAHLVDATELARTLGAIDLLYIDPPYNARQYSGYYHIPEVIARGWFDEPLTLRGKTGLLDSVGQRSAWCSPRRVRHALTDLLTATGARHVLVSYNSEGLLPDADLRAVLAEASVDGKVRRFSKTYRRYRADADSETRRYKAGEVRELLYHARLR